MTDTTLITCPDCGADIPLTDALTGKLKQQLRTEVEQHIKEKEAKISEREKQLHSSQKNLEEEVKRKVETGKKDMWEQALKAAKESQNKNIEDLKIQNEERRKKLEESEKNELELRRKARELEEKDKKRELEMARKMDEERGKMEEKMREHIGEETRKKMSEKDQQLEQLKKTIDDLKRKSEQGSMQLQGDSQEEALKNLLQTHFPIDRVEDVVTGVRGADLHHTVRSELGQECGVILWESKITKQWNDSWIQKLKDDQIDAKADIAILITSTLPRGVKNFTQVNGVWIVNFASILSITSTIRFHLIEMKRSQKAIEGQDEKMKVLYQYLSGPQFRNRVENIVSAFSEMKEHLDKEKRYMTNIWAKREKEIERVMLNTSGMYGDLQGISGSSLPNIQSLELPSGEEDTTLF